MGLTEMQIIYIENELRRNSLTYNPLKDEILDHFCCLVENGMDEGLPFYEAYNRAAEEVFTKEELRNVQKSTRKMVSARQRVFHFTSSLAASLIAIVTVFFFTNAADAPSIKPFNPKESFRISSSFGMRMHPIKKKKMHHNGIDFPMPIGTPILASGDGNVTVAEFKKGYGNTISIAHDEIYTSTYAQLSEILVEPGHKVKKGDVIAYSGNSGASTAPHLHYEVTKNGKHVDPEEYF